MHHTHDSYDGPTVNNANAKQQKQVITSFKSTMSGTKVIRIEIYDADQFEDAAKSICTCNAMVCAQHVVQNEFTDHIYPRIRDIIKCIDNNFYVSL